MKSPAFETKLYEALSSVFAEDDAAALAEVLTAGLGRETIRYGDIADQGAQAQELMLLACDERLLIPLASRSGPAWEDRILDFGPDGLLSIPPVTRAMLMAMGQTGRPCCEAAVREALAEAGRGDDDGFVDLLRLIVKEAENYVFEVGLLEILARKVELKTDLHDFLDIAVAAGLMSPYPRKSLLTGLSWYELNPVLYWDKAFCG